MKPRNRFAKNCFALLAGFVFAASSIAFAIDDASYLSTKNGKGHFPLSAAGQTAALWVSAQDHAGVIRVAKHLQSDIGSVTNRPPELSFDKISSAKEIVIIGTLGKSPLLDQLVQDKKLDVSGIAGKWETFLIQVIDKPLPNVDRMLVIVGSDKRGTIFGMYDLAAQIGVSRGIGGPMCR